MLKFDQPETPVYRMATQPGIDRPLVLHHGLNVRTFARGEIQLRETRLVPSGWMWFLGSTRAAHVPVYSVVDDAGEEVFIDAYTRLVLLWGCRAPMSTSVTDMNACIDVPGEHRVYTLSRGHPLISANNFYVAMEWVYEVMLTLESGSAIHPDFAYVSWLNTLIADLFGMTIFGSYCVSVAEFQHALVVSMYEAVLLMLGPEKAPAMSLFANYHYGWEDNRGDRLRQRMHKLLLKQMSDHDVVCPSYTV
jgi:hypothetical protein